MKRCSVNNNQSAEFLNESLSAVLDGESSELELHRVLASMQDQETRTKAKSYQLMGDVLRNQHNRFNTIDLSDAIRTKIAEEPDLTTAKNRPTKLSRHFGRAAVAASVTLAVIVGVRTWNAPVNDQSVNISQSASSNNLLLTQNASERTQEYGARGLLAGSQAKQTSLTTGQLNTAENIAKMNTLERFRAYSLNHAEQLATRNIQGMLPFVRAVSFQSH